MQIIIPMSGFGERFRRAGYDVPKPLIKVDSKEIIAHVVDMFPDEADFLFICNQEHLENHDFNMRGVLERIKPSGKIFAIPSHKFGPIYAVMQIQDSIKMDEPCIVNYCDFTCYWNWGHFKQWLQINDCDGALPAYKGFHPHSLGTTNYAYIKEESGWLFDIQEKKPFTQNKLNEFASSGTYYFKSGKLMLEAFKFVISRDLHVNHEYYVSMAYKYLVEQKKSVSIYPLQHFMQWGTPEDLEEYQKWSSLFSYLLKNKNNHKKIVDNIVVPMAGLGQRFKNEGFIEPKPLIQVSGKPMIQQVLEHTPQSNRVVFVTRTEIGNLDFLKNACEKTNRECQIKYLTDVTEGQAISTLNGLENIPDSESVLVTACDNIAFFNEEKLEKLIKDSNIDVIVFGFSGHSHAIQNPHMYGWIKHNNQNRILSISVKKPLDSPQTDPIIIGSFIFKRAGDLNNSIRNLQKRNGRINGEFYLDSCIEDAIELGLNCFYFSIDHYLSWGTPSDLYTFKYWQSCFHKWMSHNYSLSNDFMVEKSSIDCLSTEYKAILPQNLEHTFETEC